MESYQKLSTTRDLFTSLLFHILFATYMVVIFGDSPLQKTYNKSSSEEMS